MTTSLSQHSLPLKEEQALKIAQEALAEVSALELVTALQQQLNESRDGTITINSAT